MQELATSMEAHGFYGHLVARQVADRYQIAYGERRLRAAHEQNSANCLWRFVT
jgi:ParB-like chromosome segregation protein Spo0J